MSAPQFSVDDVCARLAGTELDAAQAQAEPLAQFLNLLSQWSAVHNLTGFRDADSLLDRVLLECLLLRTWLAGETIADIGSGAGLPGLPLAITEPERSFTLIESRAKRVHFLQHVAGALGLNNVEVAHMRAEDLPAERSFATVLGRAVAAPQAFVTLARRICSAGGRIVLLTSPEKSAELRGQPAGMPADVRLTEVVPAGPQGRYGVIVRLDRIE